MESGAGEVQAGTANAPDLTCDIVLKGGITSGIVYPEIVCRLAPAYRFVNVGGASAGAIAAAATAAAEYGRQRGGDGFGVLASLPRRLGGTTAAGDTTLLSLFEPQPSTRPLLRVGRAALEPGTAARRAVRAAAVAVATAITSGGWWRVMAAAVPGIAVLTCSVLAVDEAWGAVVLAVIGALLLLLGLVAGAAWALTRRLIDEVPRNYLGLVNGSGSDQALTPWLHAVIQQAAGIDLNRPLTLADLWGAADEDAARACIDDPGRRRINLEVMTTNLGEGRPQRLPLLTEEYFFRKSEFGDLFPAAVVDTMLGATTFRKRDPAEQREFDLVTQLAGAHGLHRMPIAELPVVVAARMSLSFPVLLSAVPLYRIDFSQARTRTAVKHWREWLKSHPDDAGSTADPSDALGSVEQPAFARCWISDGGITSNMPLHFFDAPLPSRPTFVVNLRDKQDGDATAEPDCTAVLAEDNRQGLSATFTPLGDGEPTLGKFATAIVRTMQTWVDNAQMRMPGYRDRIVTVYLPPGLGGLNLRMDATEIDRLAAGGAKAGDLLVSRFAAPSAAGWPNHRWVRFRSFMGMVEGLLAHVGARWDLDDGSQAPTYHHLADDVDRPGGYPLPKRAQPWVHHRTGELHSLSVAWPDPVVGPAGRASEGSFADGEPRPRGVWRGQPEL